jgi:hypothetical protein
VTQYFNHMESRRRKVGSVVDLETLHSLLFLFTVKFGAWITMHCNVIRWFLGNLKTLYQFHWLFSDELRDMIVFDEL